MTGFQPVELGLFDLVVSTDVFEHLHEADAEAAAREATRVARSYVFMKIATREDATEKWKEIAGHPLHLTTQPLTWWKKFFADAGRFIRSEEFVFCLELNKGLTNSTEFLEG